MSGWAAQFSDINPKEHLWFIIKEKIAKKPAKDLVELKGRILEEWNQISSELSKKTLLNLFKKCIIRLISLLKTYKIPNIMLRFFIKNVTGVCIFIFPFFYPIYAKEKEKKIMLETYKTVQSLLNNDSVKIKVILTIVDLSHRSVTKIIKNLESGRFPTLNGKL